MSWDTTLAMVQPKANVPPSERLADTIRVHIERARRATARDGELEQMVKRVPVPSFFVVGVVLGIMFAMTVVTLFPRSARAASPTMPVQVAATVASDSPRVLVVARPLEVPFVAAAPPEKCPAPRGRVLVRRRAPVRADTIFSNAL
jgi:hypothetical protein